MLDNIRGSGQASQNNKMLKLKEFGKKVDAHQSVLVKNGLRELLEEQTSPTITRAPSVEINTFSRHQRNRSGDWSSSSQLGDRYSNGGSPPMFAVSGPQSHGIALSSYNVAFLDEYKHLFTPGCVVAQVQFKHVFRDYVISAALLAANRFPIGEFVIVESHYDPMQVDLGVLVKLSSLEMFLQMKSVRGRSQDKEENSVGRIVRVASPQERTLLVPKHGREKVLLDTCKLFAASHHLAMNVYGVEFQFDGKILFVYYTADSRVDYRGLVYDMVRECNHTRVKMKKTNQCRRFLPKEYATVALATGLGSDV